MPKVLCMTGIVIAIVILVIALLDLFLGSEPSTTMDIVFIICAAGIAYVSWDTQREID